MPTNVTLNGVSYAIPATGEGGWGTAVTNYLVALASGVLQKAGGSFTLTAETDFGATYGLKSVYFKSRNTPATAGIFRLGNAEAVSWRNAANGANLDLKVNSSDILEFNGNPITTLALGAAHEVLTMNAGATAAEYAKIDNDNVASAAAIDAAKIADASVSNAEFQYLNGVSSAIQTQLDAKLDDVATANDNEIPRFNTNGQALQNSGVTIDDSNNMAGIANVIISGAIDAASAANLDIGGTTATTVNIGRSGQTTVIKGDLQVDGTTTTVNSTVLDVADKNITVNNGGNQASADGGGFTVEMSDATDVAMVYASALASRFKIGDVGSETEVMSVGAVQVITAVKSFDIQLVMKEIATPSTPASGYRAIYPKNDGKLYQLDDAGIEQEIGSGSGGGGINHVTSPDAEDNTVGDWVTYDDGAVSEPVDGTGGTASNLTLSAQATTIIRGSYSFKLAKGAADAQGEGMSIPITIPKADEKKLLRISLDYNTDGAYADGDIGCYVYDVTNAVLITPNVSAIPGWDKDDDGSATHWVSFTSSESNSYRLIFHVTSTNASAWDFYPDNIFVSPDKQGLGEHVEDKLVAKYSSNTAQNISSATYTIIDFEDKEYDEGSNSDNATIGASWKFTAPRDGKYLVDASVLMAATTAWAASEVLLLSIFVNGVSIARSGYSHPYTDGSTSLSASASIHQAVDLLEGDYFDVRVYQNANNPLATSGITVYDWVTVTEVTDKRTGLNLISDSLVNANARMVTTGLSGAQTISTATHTPITTWDNTTVEGGGSFDGTEYTIPSDGWYQLNAALRWSTAISASTIIKFVKNGSTDLGLNIDIFSAASSPTSRGQYLGKFVAGDTVKVSIYQDSGGNEDIIATDEQTYFNLSRLADFTAGQAIGFGIATADNAGLVSKFIGSNTELESGTFIPSLTNSTNVSATTAFTTGYSRVGNYVQACGIVNVDITTGGVDTSFTMEVPILDSAASYASTGGTAAGSGNEDTFRVYGISSGEIQFRGAPLTTANQTYSFTYGYYLTNGPA